VKKRKKRALKRSVRRASFRAPSRVGGEGKKNEAVSHGNG
jgi:hypothetical protein